VELQERGKNQMKNNNRGQEKGVVVGGIERDRSVGFRKR